MIQAALNGMLTMLMAKFMLNDLPHASGLLPDSGPGRPASPGQLRYIAILSQELRITVAYEERVRTFGEAGLMISELKAEKAHRVRRKR